jgi:hypothetical protein
MTDFEENRQTTHFWSWMLLLVLCTGILGWGFFIYFSVPDRTPPWTNGPHPRDWNFDAFGDAPGQSPYSTAPPPAGPATRRLIEPPPIYQRQATQPASAPNSPAASGRPGGRP